jgi:hypothetical protein
MRKLMSSRRSLLPALFVLALPWSFGKTAMAQNDDVDLAALARLRPGAPASALETALGRRWRAPAPHQGGLVDIVENSHHFKARIDVGNVVREVRYFRLFDSRFSIEGLRIGMTLEEVRAARPDIEIGAIMVGGPMRYGSLRLPGTIRLTLMFSNDFLHEISFWTEDAVYPPEGPPTYPAAAGALGAPFKDPNLKLLALSDLRDRKVIDLGSPQELAEYVLKRKVDLEDEGYDLIQVAYEYLARYPLSPNLLAQVKRLEFDGGNEIFDYAWKFWGGETDDFNVTSLEGIEYCVNLEEIYVAALLSSDAIDLRQLAVLSKLRRIDVSVELRHLEVLLEMPALRQITLRGNEIYNDVMKPGHPSRLIMEKLKARGVRVWVRWTSWPGSPGPPAYQ